MVSNVLEESGVRSQESGVRSQESGVRSQELGGSVEGIGVRCQSFILTPSLFMWLADLVERQGRFEG
jgi:hypothetical protein